MREALGTYSITTSQASHVPLTSNANANETMLGSAAGAQAASGHGAYVDHHDGENGAGGADGDGGDAAIVVGKAITTGSEGEVGGNVANGDRDADDENPPPFSPGKFKDPLFEKLRQTRQANEKYGLVS